MFSVKFQHLRSSTRQESRAVARKPRDAAAVLFSLKFVDIIQYMNFRDLITVQNFVKLRSGVLIL